MQRFLFLFFPMEIFHRPHIMSVLGYLCSSSPDSGRERPLTANVQEKKKKTQNLSICFTACCRNVLAVTCQNFLLNLLLHGTVPVFGAGTETNWCEGTHERVALPFVMSPRDIYPPPRTLMLQRTLPGKGTGCLSGVTRLVFPLRKHNS